MGRIKHCVSIGEILRRRVQAQADRDCRTLASQVRYLVLLALSVPVPPDLDDDRGLANNPGRADAPRSVWLRAPEPFWSQVDERARRMGETRSEAIRTLVEAGMALREGGERRG